MDRLRPGARNTHLGRTVGKTMKISSQKKSLLRRDKIFDPLAPGIVAQQSEGSEIRVSDLKWMRGFFCLASSACSHFVYLLGSRGNTALSIPFT